MGMGMPCKSSSPGVRSTYLLIHPASRPPSSYAVKYWHIRTYTCFKPGLISYPFSAPPPPPAPHVSSTSSLAPTTSGSPAQPTTAASTTNSNRTHRARAQNRELRHAALTTLLDRELLTIKALGGNEVCIPSSTTQKTDGQANSGLR